MKYLLLLPFVLLFSCNKTDCYVCTSKITTTQNVCGITNAEAKETADRLQGECKKQ